MRHSEVRFRKLLEFFPAGVLVVDHDYRIVHANRIFAAMFGYDRSELIGSDAALLIPGHFPGLCRGQQTGIASLSRRGEMYGRRKDGSEFPAEIHCSPIENGEHRECVLTVRDISEQKRIEEQLEYHANHDSLTGLPNRYLLADRINQALLHARRFGKQVAALFIDLDHFKSFLTGLGHESGELVLQTMAMRLKACVRANDTVARLGDDIFVVVLTDLNRSEDAAGVAEKIRETVRRPLELEMRAGELSCSIGIAVYPKDGGDVRTLLKNAEVAMFRAKENGRDRFQFFTDHLNARIASRITLELSLRQALDNEELEVVYQPQMDLQTGRIVGCEALIRWRNPVLGTVAPMSFIPLAEETGLIIPLGEWVLKTACRDNKRWQENGYGPLPVAVNISPRQFSDPGLVDTIAGVLRDSGLAPHFLELEITEGMVMRDVENGLAMLNELKKLGVVLSIDDFGTGYSNLSHLKHFPFDKLKMDITFVREVTHDPECAAIARTIIAMAHNLDMRVVAEGVETEGQLNYLRRRGCDEMQGFYFSVPLSCELFEQLLAEDRTLALPEEEGGRFSKTVLLVDDEPPVVSSMARTLRKEGYTVFTATGTGDGFEFLAVNRIAVILSDLRMPGMDGIEFLSRVSRLHPGTIRMAMSGHADADMVAEAINRGAISKFLVKPVGKADLLQHLDEALSRFEESTKNDERFSKVN